MTCFVILIALACVALQCAATAASATLDEATKTISVSDATPLAEAFEKGQLARDVQMAPDGSSVILYDLALIEDDGPAACGSRDYGPAAPTAIRGGAQVKKVLRLDRAGVLEACVVVCAGPWEGEKQPLRVDVNGREFAIEGAQVRISSGDWPAIRLPAGLLREGDNEIVLSCPGAKGWWSIVAQRELILRNAPERKGRPNRSFRSSDGGKTWSPGLGDDGGQNGELMVRLQVSQYAARGELVGPVIDLAAGAADGRLFARPRLERDGEQRADREQIRSAEPSTGKGLGRSVHVESVRLSATKKLPDGTAVALFIRSGEKPVYDPACWSEWEPAGTDSPKRFVQWRAVLSTRDPKTTPVLQAVKLQAQVRPRQPAWAANVKLLDSHNEEIRYTSMPFEYEKFDEPRLVALRTKYKLDEVVAGARNETEKMIKLRNWIAAQWKYVPPTEYYPAWDADEILQLRKGFCVQYAIVCTQCALALGMQARFVFGHFPNVTLKGRGVSGHEVTEVWHNELGKWVMMDAQRDESFVDRRNGELAGMLELHEDQLDTYFPGGIVEEGKAFEDGVPSKRLLWWKGAEPAARTEDPVLDIKWGQMQWMPRNNFYAHRFPEPVRQGLGWSWPDYWNWEDSRSPREKRFGRYTRRLSDIAWTINQVRWAAAPAEQPGNIRVGMGTVTPDFDTFLVSVDGGEWRSAGDTYNWPLRAGKNRLEMRVRNRAGILGRRSWIEVEYDGGAAR